MQRLSTYALGATTLIVVAIGGSYLWNQLSTGETAYGECTQGAVAGGALGGPFTLVSETGETVTDADVITEPTLIYFGYTFCPDVCPLDSMRNGMALDILEERGVDARGVFITVDPARDTVDVVRDFTDNFHDDMIGLTGTPEQIDAAAKAYRVFYDLKTEEDPEFYLVDHSAFTYFVMPGTGFVDVFRREATPEQMAETVACVAELAGV